MVRANDRLPESRLLDLTEWFRERGMGVHAVLF